MKRFTKLYTWLVITVFYFNITMASAYCVSNDNSGNLHISKSLASVSKTYTPSSSNNQKFIIHIKDIHCNYKVQKNISLILKQLITDRTTSLVTLEGAQGIVDTSVFSIIPDKNAKQSVCSNFMKKGVLTGAENLSIIEGADLPFTLWGIEDTDLYLKNFQTFRNIKFAQKNAQFILNKVENLITLIKTKFYPHNLYDFDQQCQNVKNIENQAGLLNRYAKKYNISTKNYTAFYNFCNLLKTDENAIDYAILENEKVTLLKQLKNDLNPADYKKVSSIDTEFNIDSISPYEYFDTLTGLLKEDSNNYPMITNFINREKLKSSIRHNLLETDLKNLEKDIKSKIISNNLDSITDDFLVLFQQLDEASELLPLYRHLLNLQLTDKELSLLSKTDLSLNKIIKKLSDSALKLGINDTVKYIPTDTELKNIQLAANHCKFFYKIANERSKTMVANLIEKMDSQNQNTAVLIAGGFHSNKIEKELEKNKIKYVTLTPNTAEVNSANYTNYINLMLDEKIDLSASSNLPLAQYISFPVLCSMLVQKSGYFHSLRQELAIGLLTYGNHSIAQYRKQLNDSFSLKMLDRLIALSGLNIDNEQDTMVETLITDISPKKIADQILTYDNKKLDMEIRATDPHYYDSMTVRKILAAYLFSILEIAVKVNSSTGDEKSLLNYIKENSSSPDKSIIRSVAEERLTDLEKSSEPFIKQKQPVHQQEDTELKNFAFKITRELAKAGLVDISDSITVNDIKIGKTNLTGLTKGGIEDRISFEIQIPSTDGSTKIFYAKSARYGDFEQLGAEAFKALNRQDFQYFHSDLRFKDYFGFHVTEHVGDMSLSEIDPASDNITDLADHLGEALAEAHLLGLIDRSATNLRVILKNGKPVKIVNIDLTNALGKSNIPISYQAETILSLLRKAKKHGADKQQIANIALKFMTNFANSLVSIQTYYANNKETIDNYEPLSGSPRWHDTLKRLNPQLYDTAPVINDFMTIINDEFGLNIRLKSNQTQKMKVSEIEQVTEFIRLENFRRFDSQDNSIAAKLFINKAKNVFLKTSPNLLEGIRQRLPVWRLHPRTIITNAVSLILMRFFSHSPVHIALYKIGDIVPPMFVFKSKKEILITRSDRISSGYFQKRVAYTLKEAFKILAKQGKTDQINALIEKYFQLQLTMMKRGVIDRDPFLMQNYGIDDINSLELKCFDFGATTSFLPLALHVPLAVYKFQASADQLNDIVPAQCVDYYRTRYKEVFNPNNIFTLWKTEQGVKAKQLSFDLNSPIEFTASTDMNAHESFYNFIKNAKFTPFLPTDSSANADLFRSQDGRYYIKTESSYIKKIKNRIPEWKKSPLSFFTNAIGDILTVISHVPPNFIARRVMGDCVPAMLEFDYKEPIRITQSRFISKGYVQREFKYSLVDVFAILTKKGDIRQINLLIDRFFEIQTTMLSRGVFDEDIFFSQNYGVNDIYSTDIQWFDFGRAYPFLFLPLKACVTKGKFNHYIDELSEIIPPECIKHYTKRYKEVFNIENILKIWNTKDGVQAETIPISSILEDKFPDYLGGSYNTKGFVKTFLESINMSNHPELEKSLVDILEQAKNAQFALTIDDLVEDKVSYLKLIATIASTKAEFNQKLVKFSIAAATSINNYKTSPALIVAIQKTVFDYIADMPTEKEYKLPERFNSLIESSL